MGIELQIFIDKLVIEVFANERQCVTQRVYPTRPDSRGVEFFSKGRGRLKDKTIKGQSLVSFSAYFRSDRN